MRWFFALLLALALAAAVPALAAEAPLVSVQIKPAQPVVAPGGQAKLELVLTIAPSFHINGPSAGEAGLIPTQLSLSAPAGLSLGKPVFPKASEVRVQFADKPVEMYSGAVAIGLSLKADAKLKAGVYTVKGLLSFQACDDAVCHMPSRQEFSFPVKVGR